MSKINARFYGAWLCLEMTLTALCLAVATPLVGQTGCNGPLNVGCIANVNVTLNADCAVTVTPSMVLTGNHECADEIQITVDNGNTNVLEGCGTHTYMVVVIDNGQQVYTCWGTLLAEDKTDPVISCPANTSEVTVDLTAQVLTGTLAATDPGIQLDNYSCFLEVFPPLPGNHYYDLHTFTVNNPEGTGVFTFDLGTAWGDGTMALYAGTFNPTNPCENIIAQADDLIGGSGFFVSFDPSVRLSAGLSDGETYTLLVSSWAANQTGDYAVAVFGENGSLNGSFTTMSAPVTFDLICTDIDQVLLTTPTSYTVDADGQILSIPAGLQTILELTGFPQVSDNCGNVRVTVTDVVTTSGDCGNTVIARTFRAADRFGSTCTGTPRIATCQQIITLRKPTVPEIFLPNYTTFLECDEDFPGDGSVGGPDNNPAASVTGYPYVRTAFGIFDLNPTYCNLGASYSDEPRINVCTGSYTFRREWTLVDWCNPQSNIIYDQYVKVGDYTGPTISGVPAVINVSTSPFNCLANFLVPNPQVADANGCSNATTTSYTILLNGTTFFRTGNIGTNVVVQVPEGNHTLILCARDACNNETCVTYDLVVRDLIDPTAVCDDELNVSIGGGDSANGIQGIARVFASSVNEGSNDNCGPVTLEVRRNYWRNNDCDPSPNRWSPWGDFVDFYCCDVANEITIELRVTDASGNRNVCWMVVTPEDKLNPFCYAPANQSLSCAELPLAFPGNIETAYDEDFAATSIMMTALFGGATGTDNCAVDTIVERTPNLQLNSCGWGTITRRFEAWQVRPEGDVNGNGAIDIGEVFRSTNSCSQVITITETHDFTIDFPEDTDADCGDPDIPTLLTEARGCDQLVVNIGNPVRFTSAGDECYKLSITYDVINWCLWDGEYTGYTLARMTEDDGEALPIDRAVEGNERPVVRYTDQQFCIDRRHTDRDGDSSLPNCDSPVLPNYGRYKYTQFIKVYDSTAPTVSVGTFGGPTANCPDLLPGQFGDDDGNCEENVSIPFSVADDCELFNSSGNLVVQIVSAEIDFFAVDANNDGTIKANEFVAEQNALSFITNNGDGTFVFSGNFPVITAGMGPNVYHAFRVLFRDGCGNQTSRYVAFDVVDCKGPAPICINGLTVTLMPLEPGTDADGDGDVDGCGMAIWASDFEASPIYDCTGQGPAVHPQTGQPRVTKYAIYRAADVEADPNFVPNPADTGLVLTDDDDATTIVYVYAFDEEGNYDYCETYLLVQQHVTCNPSGTGTVQGLIATESNQGVQGVEVSVNGGGNVMTTGTDGLFTFALPQGGDYSIAPYLNADPLNGVSTFDLVLMAKHILGVQALNGPYRRIAADVNRSGTITTLDMIQLRKLILNIEIAFANNTSWRFIPTSYAFPVPTNPWATVFPELTSVNNLAGTFTADFVAVKIGDVNGSAQPNALTGDNRTVNGEFNLTAENESLKAGNVYTVAVRAADLATIEGFQGTLQLNGAQLMDVEFGVMKAEHFGLRYAESGHVTFSWDDAGSVATRREAVSDGVLFSLVIRPAADAELSEVLSVTSRYTVAEAYGNGNVMNVGMAFTNGEPASQAFALYQNTPNPCVERTTIAFNLPEAAATDWTLTITDVNGRVLSRRTGVAAKGYQAIEIDRATLGTYSGVAYYTLTAGDFSATKTMIVLN